MKYNSLFKRFLAIVLMVMMLLSSMPLDVLAEDVSGESEPVADQVEVVSEAAPEPVHEEPVPVETSSNDDFVVLDDVVDSEPVDEEPVEVGEISLSDLELADDDNDSGDSDGDQDDGEEDVSDGIIIEEPEPEVVDELSAAFVIYPDYARVDERVDAFVKIIGGKAPYTITNEGSEFVVETDGEQVVNLVPKTWGEFTWNVFVTDSLGTTVQASCDMLVSSNDTNEPAPIPELRGDMTFAEKLVAIALSQVGYKESDSNFIVREDGSIQGWSYYGNWYGMPYEEWCAMFVSYCVEMAGIPKEAIPRCANNQRWKEQLGNKYIDNEDDYEPSVGDIVFFHHDRVSDDPNFPNHVGIVTEVKGDSVHIFTVEGNTGKAVKEHKYDETDEVIVGYVSMREIMEKYDPNYAPEEVEDIEIAGVEPEGAKRGGVVEAGAADSDVVIRTEDATEIDAAEVSVADEDVSQEGAVGSESTDDGIDVALVEGTEHGSESSLSESEGVSESETTIREETVNGVDGDDEGENEDGTLAEGSEDVTEDESEDEPVLETEDVVYVVTTTDRLNIREEPDGIVIDVIDGPGARLVLLPDSELGVDAWYHVQFGDIVGYCSAAYLVPEESADVEDTEDADGADETGDVGETGDTDETDGGTDGEPGEDEGSDGSEDLSEESTEEGIEEGTGEPEDGDQAGDEDPEVEETIEYEAKDYTYTGNGLTVVASTVVENQIPSDAILSVSVVDPSDARAVDYAGQAATMNGVAAENVVPYVYEIHFESVDGDILPVAAGTVSVRVTFDSALTVAANHVFPFYHVVNGTLVLLVANVADANTVNSFDFSTDSFSDFVMADVNATQYDYDNKYAILYSNGDLVFQQGNRPDETKGTVAESWTGFDNNDTHPWSGRTDVKRVIYDVDVKTVNATSYFHGMSGLTEIVGLEHLDTSTVRSFSKMFHGCSKLANNDFDKLNTDMAVTCGSMFYSCQKIRDFDYSKWTLSNVTNVESMFYNCDALTNVDLSSWSLANAGGLANMFYDCDGLISVKLVGAMPKVTSLSSMFYSCNSLLTVDMDTCVFEKVSSTGSMFYGCSRVETVKCSAWDMRALSSCSYMFHNCSGLKNLDVSSWNINGNNYLYPYYMFYNCSSLEELNLDSWTATLCDSFYMFANCTKLRKLDLGSLRLGVSYNNYYMFYYCSNLEKLDLSGVTSVAQSSTSSLSYYLYNTRKLAYVDLSGYDVTAGGNTRYFFTNSGLSKVTFGPNWRFSDITTDYQLPAGTWRRVGTDDVYSAEELARLWNSEMAGTYEKVASISFDPQGGSASKRRVVKYLSEPIYDGELPTATRNGYSFLGWFTDPEGGTQLQVGDVPDKIVYYAHWSENEYTLILKRNVEDDPNDTDVRYNLLYSEIFQLDPSIFENGDRVIQAWTTNADGSGTSYGADAEVAWLSGVDGGTATLYAKWGRTRFATVNFDSQGGMEISPIVIERGQQLTPLMYSLPNREDYTFMGWYDDPEGGTRWDTSNHTVTESKTLYAHWSRNPVISFNPNGGWVEYMTKQVPYGGSLGVLPNAESRPEKLIGYYTSQTPSEGTKLTTSTVFTEDTTYYAHWGYQPEFKTVGGKFVGSFDLNSVYPVDYEREQTIHTLPQVTRDGYRFVKWILSDGTEVHEGDIVDIYTYPDITAVWELDNQVTVTFDPDGGLMVGGGTRVWKVASGDRLGYYPYASKSINNRNAEFLGWFDENDNEYFADTVITENVALKAKYNNRIYTNTFVTNNPSFTRNPIYLGVNEPFGVVPGLQTVNGVPVSGQYLEGWYTSADPFEADGVTLKDGVIKLTPETTVSEDTTWYAHILNNKVDDVHEGIAYTYYAEWSNASNSYLDNSDNNLDFHPNSNSNIVANLHLHFELNGAVSSTLPVGDVRISIPKYVFKNWDDQDAGTNNLSAQIPAFPRVQSGMWFSYIDKGDHYEIVNNQPISGGAGVDLTVAYSIAPYLVPGGAVDRNGDYVPGYDFYQADIPIRFEMGGEYEVDSANGTISYMSSDVEKTTDLSLEVHTKAEPYISKSVSNVYYEWQSSWGPKPADADDYFYISWSVLTYAQNVSTYYTYRVSEDTLHDGTVVANDVLNVGSQATNDYYFGSGNWRYIYPVIKYEKSLLENPPSTGVILENQAKIELTTRAGYTIETIAKGTHTMYEWKYTKGEFDKTNTNGGVYQLNGGQDKLLDDQSLDLTWELHYDGNSADTPILWDDEAQSYHRDQRVISIADGVNSDLFLSSGEPSSKYAWEPTTGNYVLSDDDYRINRIRIYTREYDGSLINDEWGGPTLRSDYQNWKDIDVYVRHAGSNDLVFYKSVRPWATYCYGVGTTGAHGYTDVTLPADAVGYEVRYPTSYFSTYMQVYMYATIFPTTKVKSLVASDVAKNVYTEIKNRGYCNIWTSGDPYTDPDPKSVMFYPNTWTKDNHTGTNVFFHVTDWTGGFNGANKEIYELTKTNASIYVRKSASDQGNVVFDVERGFQENPMVIYGWNYASNFTAYMQRGVFYDLLPLGATVNEETIFGIPFVYNGTSASYSANNYNTESASSGKLAKAYYSVEFIENWEGSGRTMMRISFMMPPSGKYNAVRFYYKQKMSYADVINYGTSVENDVAFVDLTDSTYVYNSESQTLVNAQFAEPDLFLPIERANDHPAYYKARSNYLPVDAFSWGFSKAVKTKDYYTDSDTTIPNNLYTYRLTFAQSDFATSDSIVFFDVFENGAYGVEDTPGVEVLTRASDWHGVFESIDIASLRTKLKANTTDIYLNPVVYYSTKDRDTFTGEDWNVANSATWSTVKPANNADITAVAVDCTKSSDGSDFIMTGRETMSVYITMRAPSDEEYIDTSAVNQARFRGNINNEPSEATSDTTVTYTEEEPEIHKSSDPETGTQDDPAVMSAGQELVYTITVKNKNQEFTVPNIVVEDDVPDELLIDKNNIKVHFGDPSTVSLLSINPRVDLTSTGNHLRFNINTLASNETCYLLIPCTAKAVGNVVIENTSEITSVNGVDKDIDSETTYHKIRYDVLFSKQSDQKRLVIGATLQLWDMDGDPEPVLIEEWVTGTSNKVIQLDPGHFKLVETDVPSGYKQADDILFTIETDGTVRFEDDSTDTKVVMVDVESTTVKGVKHWKWDQESDRPESVTVKLMRTIDEAVAPVYADMSIDVTADDNWAYDFGLVPKYDSEGHEYIYSVQEEPVAGYTDYYTDSFETNGLALTFSNKTKTYDNHDYFEIYYKYRDKWFGSPTYYGRVGAPFNPGGSTIYIPANDFYVVWYTDGSNNDYGFKFDQILPVVMDTSSPYGTRKNMPSWTSSVSVEEYSGSRYPETDHEYFVYEKMVMHYSRESEGNVLDIVNTKNTPRYDVSIDKISEDGNKIGGVVMRLTSAGDVGDAQIDPIEWTTVEDQSKVLQLYPGHYLLHEVSCVDGYQFADDIEFTVNGVGEVLIDGNPVDRISMIDKYAVNKYPFRKVWMDDGFESLRPSSVSFNLVRVSDSEVVATKSLTSADAVDDSTWEGWFDDVLIVDEHWEPIEYVVREVVTSSDYRVYHDVQNKVGFYITFTEDSDLGSGKLWIFPGGGNNDGQQPYNYMGNGRLALNPEYNMDYAEGTDMAGKTYFVPILNGVEAFVISRSWASDSVKLEIESIVPALTAEPYEIYGSGGPSFTNVFSGKNYPNLNSDGVSTATYQWASQLNESDDIVVTDEVVNYVNKINVPFVKYWDNELDETDDRPGTLTFRLYNVNNMAEAVSSITVDVTSDASATYAFENVPKYNDDWSLAKYVVREDSVPGYRTFVSPDTVRGLLVTFSDDSTAGSGTMYLYGKNENYMNASASLIDYRNGVSYNYISGTGMAGKTYYVPVMDSEHPGFVLYVTGDSSMTAKLDVVSVVPVDYTMSTVNIVSGMPTMYLNSFYEGSSYPSIHSSETGRSYWYAGYDYDVSKKDVHNVKDETRMPVTKIWSDDGPDSRPESITVNAVNILDRETVVGSVTLDVSDADSENQWSGVITGLPRYNDDGSLAEYVLVEEPVDGYFARYEKPKGMLVTFSEDSFAGANGNTNYINLFTVSKNANYRLSYIWPKTGYSSSLYGNAISGRTFYIPITSDGDYSFGIYKSNSSDVVKIESVQLTTQEQEYNYSYTNSWINASEYWYRGTGSFDMTGRSGYMYYDYTGVAGSVMTGGASVDNVITNEKDVIDVPFVKQWIDFGYEADRPDSLTFGLYNERDPEHVVSEITVNRSDVEEGNVWNAVFEGVPKFNDDGTLAVYVVREMDDLDDYTGYDSVRGIKGFLLKFSEDTDLTNGSLYIWQSNGYQAVNYVRPSVSGNGSGYWYGSQLSPAGRTVYVPLATDGVYEFMIQLWRGSSSYTNVHYTIESITPVYEDLPYSLSTGYTAYRNLDYNYYELVENVSSLSRDFSAYGTSTNVIYTWVRWNIDNSMAHGLINRKNVQFVRFHKFGVNREYVSGATLQVLKKSDNALMAEWETNVYDYELGLAPGEYILHEAIPPVGFAQAEDIEFSVSDAGVITVDGLPVDRVEMKDNELIDVKGQKAWLNDNVSQRPSSITVNLYQNDVIIDSVETTLDEDWSYSFLGLPRYDENDEEYVYRVGESPVYDYAENDSPVTLSESWLNTEDEWQMPNVDVEHIVDVRETAVQGYEITLSSNSRTESVSWDWFYVYFRKNGVMYKLNNGWNGSSIDSSGKFGGYIGGYKFVVPSNDIYFVWRTDSSVRYWGWKIDSMVPLASVSGVSYSVSSLPTADNGYNFGAPIEYSGSNYPESIHDYNTSDSYGYGYPNNDRKIYHWSGPATAMLGRDDYTVSASKGLKVKFDQYSQTEQSYDKLEIYFYAGGQLFKLPQVLSGDLRNSEFIVPSRNFYLKWTSNGSMRRNGWRIASITDYDNVEIEALKPATDFPNMPPETYTGEHYPSNIGYANNETKLYRYVADAQVLPDEGDRYSASWIANISNTRQPDKQDYSVYKQDPDGNDIPGAVLEITGHEERASYDIVPIRWTTSGDGPEVVQLREGQYVLREVSVPSGYLKSADVPFMIDASGAIIIGSEVADAVYMTDVPNEQSIPVTKTWDDVGLSQYRPSSITFDLYDVNDMDTVVDTLVLTADDGWSGSFEGVPFVYEGTEEQIQYTVVERDVQYYDEEILTDFDSLDAGISELNTSSVRFVFTPNYGMKINMSSIAGCNGPVLVIWKDRVTGRWFSGSYSFSNNSVIALSASEVYMLYRSYSSNYAGIDINSVEPAVNWRSWSIGSGYEWLDEDINDVLPKAIAKYQGSSNYWPTTLTSSDFVDGSNGYHNSCVGLDYNASPVCQYVHLVRPVSPSVYTSVPSAREIADCEGFRITLGDDFGYVNGPMPLVYKASDGRYCNPYLSSQSHSGGRLSFTIKSKEFYLCYVENASPHAPGSTVVDGNYYGIYGTGHSVMSIEPVSGVSWDFNASSGSFDTLDAAMRSYSSALVARPYVVHDGRLGAPLRDIRETQVYSFDYGSMLPNYTYNDYFADHDGFVTQPVVAKNTFVVHPFSVPFAKRDENGGLLGGAHLKLYKGDGTFVSEWDTSSSSMHSETLDYGSYVLKETSVPVGYVKSADVSFQLTPIGEILVGATSVSSVDMTDNDTVVRIEKQDDVGNIIPGASMIVYSDDIDDPYDSWVSTMEQHVIRNIPEGTYVLHEVTPPAGYLQADDVVFVVSSTDGSVKVDDTVVTTVAMSDNPIHVMVHKLGASGDLSGVTFEISGVDSDESAIDLSGVTAKSNNVVLTDLSSSDTVLKYTTTGYGIDLRCVPVGHYVMHETVTVDGYTYADDVEFDVASDGTVTIDDEEVDSVDMQNTQTVVKIRKEDGDDALLEGATLQILDGDGEVVVDDWETSDEIDVFTGVLSVDTVYVLHEVEAPESFTRVDDISFKIDSSGDVLILNGNDEWVVVDDNTVVMVDIPVHDLSVTKTVTGNMGNKHKEFDFTITFDNPNIEVDIPFVKSTQEGTDVTGTVTLETGETVYTFKLADSEQIVFQNVPRGVSYEVEESAASSASYMVESENESGEIGDEDIEVSFVNDRAFVVPTGVFTNGNTVLLLLGLIAFAFVAVSKRKRYE